MARCPHSAVCASDFRQRRHTHPHMGRFPRAATPSQVSAPRAIRPAPGRSSPRQFSGCYITDFSRRKPFAATRADKIFTTDGLHGMYGVVFLILFRRNRPTSDRMLFGKHGVSPTRERGDDHARSCGRMPFIRRGAGRRGPRSRRDDGPVRAIRDSRPRDCLLRRRCAYRVPSAVLRSGIRERFSAA